ncbi:uncharacterized protein MYCGRDRAFT_103490 [Zymoseptoria tritici IPO323]|uniref:Uncharacterized protein n=1 Tax=Zymoseptoria tritici (strain CBS 115943 / IPO323) TaxID=336722 RepID=F9X4T8_ZYMTI|nr:uncharacterized protein MYCGRDRAFT_103490 [Zymoseptoria tritici IPO323]EGP90242.1 hypothetical protein MYCGRDRAFT_103490 [Zymoseptoria tritici IPO323]
MDQDLNLDLDVFGGFMAKPISCISLLHRSCRAYIRTARRSLHEEYKMTTLDA